MRTGKMMRGVGMTLAAGMVVGLIGTSMMRGNKGVRGIKRNAAKAVRAVGDFVDNVKYMVK